MDYRRVWHPGGTYFFTINLLQRKGNDLLVRHIQALREAVKAVKTRHPFEIHGWVVLPEHFHCVLELPHGDYDYATRLRLIKAWAISLVRAVERETRIAPKERAISTAVNISFEATPFLREASTTNKSFKIKVLANDTDEKPG